MTMERWNGSSSVAITTAKRWNGTSFVDLTTAKRWTGSAFVDITLPGGSPADLVATSSTSLVTRIVNSPDTAPPARELTTPNVTVTASGGAGAGPTYAWTRLSGSTGIIADNPTSNVTSFSGVVPDGAPLSAIFRCAVTRGVQTVNLQVSVYLEYNRGIIP